MRSGAVSRESTVDLTEEIYEHLARSGEVPPYLVTRPRPTPTTEGSTMAGAQAPRPGGSDGGVVAPLHE